MIAHPDVEAVSITAPNNVHRDVALAAAAAGKHLWIEKPVGRVPRGDRRDRRSSPAGGCARSSASTTGAPAVQHARRLIESGALGVLDHFRSQWVAAYAANPRGALTWRFRRDEAGLGILGDLGSHAVDLAQFLLGPIAAVTARTETIVSERPLPTAAGALCRRRERRARRSRERRRRLEHRPLRAWGHRHDRGQQGRPRPAGAMRSRRTARAARWRGTSSG